MTQSAAIDKMWRNPDTQLTRSAAAVLRENKAKLQPQQLQSQHQQQPQSQPSPHPMHPKLHKAPVASSTVAQPARADRASKPMAADFRNCKFYIDNVDEVTQKSLERRLTLLGATLEQFFSNDCTHIITSRAVYFPARNQENAPPSQKSAGKNDPFVERVIQMGKHIWGLEKSKRYLQTLMDSAGSGRSKKQAQQRELGKLYKEEKMFGVSSGQSDRPSFIPFRHYYVLVEDTSGNYRPAVVKEYRKPEDPSQESECTWPIFSALEHHDSPYLRMEEVVDEADPRGKNGEKQDEKNEGKDEGKNKGNGDEKGTEKSENKVDEKDEKNEEEDENKNGAKNGEDHEQTITPADNPATPLQERASQNTALPTPNSPSKKEANAPPPVSSVKRRALTPLPMHVNSDRRSLRASGFQPSCNTQDTSRFALTSGSVMTHGDRRILPLGASVSRLDRRMVDNQKPVQENASRGVAAPKIADEKEQLRLQEAKERELRRRQERQLEREMEKQYCENCAKKFTDFQDHIKEDNHQAFVRDKNNFKDLDALLETTRRKYKNPLPLFLSKITDASIDGKGVAIDTHSRKRPHQAMEEPRKEMARSVKSKDAVESAIASEGGSIITHSDSWEKYYGVFF